MKLEDRVFFSEEMAYFLVRSGLSLIFITIYYLKYPCVF